MFLKPCPKTYLHALFTLPLDLVLHQLMSTCFSVVPLIPVQFVDGTYVDQYVHSTPAGVNVV